MSYHTSFFNCQIITKALDALKIQEIVQFRQLKDQTLFWMGTIKPDSTLFPSVLSRHSRRDSVCLQFNIVDGVHPVTQQKIRLTNMASTPRAQVTVKEVLGETMFMYSVRNNKVFAGFASLHG